MSRRPEDLRSQRWFAPDTLRAFGHRSRMKQMGYSRDDFMGRPVIAVLNTWSGMACCHTHFRERAEQVRNGVWAAGGFPLEIPVLSLAEQFQKPTAMMYRNLLAMETEEVLRSYPIDGTVLMGGCDKTTPALLMGAIAADLPAIFLPAGPMLRGNWRGQPVGSGTDVWRLWAERRAGQLEPEAWDELEDGIARSAGHCMTMGTASTMTAAVDALGLTIPGASSIPAVDSAHARMAALCGRHAVELVWQDRRPSTLLTPDSFDNAVVTVLALGGSTNAVIHLIALARRAGIDLTLDRFDQLSRDVPVLADIQPGGRFLMEDFHYAGGLLALQARLGELLDSDARTITGTTLGEARAGAVVHNPEVIRPIERPVSPAGALAILRGSLAPDGAVIKTVAADPDLHRHRGPAVVFEDEADLEARIDDPALPVTPDSVLVLKRGGPVGAPGMPEWGMLPIPRRLLEARVRDMVRISDARMSGTSYGTCVLHVAPEAAVGGPLCFVRDGDEIELDVPRRRLDLLVEPEELARRRAGFETTIRPGLSGFGELFVRHVTQANLGCDFDFLERRSGVAEPVIH
ncbi:MAG TPA: L-arabinonate dehydratase [Solirubrobacteraceae bacterium]|jgi:dihydroxy-acid dehydratase|nr:L-arabinonate dehydratase [Solirubrobacteraceae bacterium]